MARPHNLHICPEHLSDQPTHPGDRVYKLLQVDKPGWARTMDPTCQTNGKEIQSEAQEPGLNRSEKKTNTTGNQLDQAPSELTHKEETEPCKILSWFLMSFLHGFSPSLAWVYQYPLKEVTQEKFQAEAPNQTCTSIAQLVFFLVIIE